MMLYMGQAVVGGALATPAVSAGGAKAGEHGADILLGVGDDGALLWLWSIDMAEDVISGPLLGDQPGPEGGEAGVVVEEGLVGDRLSDEEEANVLGGDLQDGEVGAQVDLEFTEGIVVVGDGVGG